MQENTYTVSVAGLTATELNDVLSALFRYADTENLPTRTSIQAVEV